MKWLRDNIESLDPYIPGMQPQEEGFVKLNTNENPYPPSPEVARVIREIRPDNLRLYPDPLSVKLRDKIAARYGFGRGNVIVGNGSDGLLALALRSFIGENDQVVLPRPSYSLFEFLAQVQAARIVGMDLNNNFSLPEAFYSANCKLKLLASPNSPTGTVYPMDVIDRVLEETEGMVLVDEAYVDFSEDTCLPLLRKYPHLIVLRTFSKSFSLAGLRIGYAFADDEIIAGMLKVKDSYNLSRVSVLAAEAALEDWDYFQRNVALVKSERDYLKKELEALGFFVFPSGANFLLVRTAPRSAKKIFEKLLSRKILVRYFDTPRLTDCLRISIGTHEELEALIAALREILK